MRKLLIACSCGERLQVPRSAMGRTGLCPACGRTVTITPSNTTSDPDSRPRPAVEGAGVWWQQRTQAPQDARREFAQAVDLYFTGRHAEALVILTSLAERFPGNPDIDAGRNLCMERLRTGARVAIEDKSQRPHPEPPRLHLPEPADLTDAVLKQFLLEKMFHSPSEEVQLKAAVLASRILGLLGDEAEATPAPTEPQADVSGSPTNSANPQAESAESDSDTLLPEWTSFLDM